MALKGVFKKAKDESKQFGFIDCPELKEYFGREVFVSKDLAGELVIGMTVCFNAALNKEGYPYAEAVTPCDLDWQPASPDLTWSCETAEHLNPYSEIRALSFAKGGDRTDSFATQPLADGKGKGQEQKIGKATIQVKNLTPTGQIMTGVVKTYHRAKMYGFVESAECQEAYGQNVFIHQNSCEGFIDVGDIVSFELILNKGKPQGHNVVKLSEESIANEPQLKKLRTGS